MKNVLHYIKTGNYPEFKDLSEANAYAEFCTNKLLTGSGDEVRERATLEMIYATQIPGKHDWDGKKGKTYIEVKNETMSIGGRYFGKGIFNNLTWKSFKKYQAGGIYLHGAYDRNGVLEFILAFRVEHLLPKMHAVLMEKLPNGDVENKNATVNIAASDFPDKVEVCYVRENLEIVKYSKRLFKLIANGICDMTKIHGARYLNSKPPVR